MDPVEVIEELSVSGAVAGGGDLAAQANRAAMVPVFLRTIDDFLELRGPVDPDAMFFMFHLLGEWREKSAVLAVGGFPALAARRSRYDPRRPPSPRRVHRVMAAVFDGDPEPLYEIIRDPEADEYIRARMLQTLAMLTRRGELPRDATAAFLRDCFSQLEPRADCYVWSGWVDAVAWLGLSELKPLAQQAFQRGSIDPEWLTFKDFEEDLQYRSTIPKPNRSIPTAISRCSAIPIEELSGWTSSNRRCRATNPNGECRSLRRCPSAIPAQSRTQRSLSLRQRQKIQEVLPDIGVRACSSWAFGGVKYRPQPPPLRPEPIDDLPHGPGFRPAVPFCRRAHLFDRRIHLFNLTSPQRNISE